MSNKDAFEIIKETNKLLAEIDSLFETLNGNIYGNKEYADLNKLVDLNMFILQNDKRIKYHGCIHSKMGKNGLAKIWVTFE